MLCGEEMAKNEGHTSAGICINTWLATIDMDEEKIMCNS
jgi:hypothetical protein